MQVMSSPEESLMQSTFGPNGKGLAITDDDETVMFCWSFFSKEAMAQQPHYFREM